MPRQIESLYLEGWLRGGVCLIYVYDLIAVGVLFFNDCFYFSQTREHRNVCTETEEF